MVEELSADGAANIVRRVYPSCTGVKIVSQQAMGFSGATVAVLSCSGLGPEPREVFLKVVEPAELRQDASEGERFRWNRNLDSYRNEVAFLADEGLQALLKERDVSMPEVMLVSEDGPRRFVILAECLTPKFEVLNVHAAARTPEVVRWIARFHSAFWGRVPDDHKLWRLGTHVHLDKQPTGQAEMLPTAVVDFCTAFAGVDQFFARLETAALGKRLLAITPRVADYLRPAPANAARITLVHGDFKGANYFLRTDGPGCTAIDWQWTGPGVGATDLIYLLCGSVEDEVVDDWRSTLRLYFEALGGVGAYTFEDLLADFAVATLDYARWVFAMRLMGDTPERFLRHAEKADINLGLFRRHLPRVAWLLRRVEEFLPAAENGSLFALPNHQKPAGCQIEG